MLYRNVFETDQFGPIQIISDNYYIIRVDFYNPENNDQIIKYVGKYYKNNHLCEDCPAVLNDTKKQLIEYFNGMRKQFDIPIRLMGTLFQKKCWSMLSKIPYGKTQSYAQEAIEIGNPRACQAVGQANHYNPISIIIPCHRVISSDGGLGGYGAGLIIKQKLLALEKSLK